MEKLLYEQERKRHIGVLLHMNPTEGGGFQYEEFILDALVACEDEYVTTVIYDNERWERILSEKYPKFFKRRIRFGYDEMYAEVDALGLDYLFISTYRPEHCFAMRFKTPIIAALHDIMYFYEPERKNGDSKNFSFFLQELCCHSVGIFVDSELGKQHCIEAFGKMHDNKIVPLPFRSPNYLYEEKEIPVALKWEKYIFYPAQLWPQKNHLNLLLAIDMLKQIEVEINLLFTGAHSGIYDYIVHVIEKLGLKAQVQILSYISGAEMRYLYRHARAAVMASYEGPTNIPPLEAMLCGCPIAVADVYAMPWQVGEAGLKFDPKSPEDIADTFRLLWENDELCRNMSDKGKERSDYFSKENFNLRFRNGMKRIISQYENRYAHLERLLDKCRGYEKVYLYGAGAFGAVVGEYLKRNGIDIRGFIVTIPSEDRKKWMGCTVYGLNNIKDSLSDAVVLVSVYHRQQREIIRELERVAVREIYLVTGQEWAEAYRYFVLEASR